MAFGNCIAIVITKRMAGNRRDSKSRNRPNLRQTIPNNKNPMTGTKQEISVGIYTTKLIKMPYVVVRILTASLYTFAYMNNKY